MDDFKLTFGVLVGTVVGGTALGMLGLALYPGVRGPESEGYEEFVKLYLVGTVLGAGFGALVTADDADVRGAVLGAVTGSSASAIANLVATAATDRWAPLPGIVPAILGAELGRIAT